MGRSSTSKPSSEPPTADGELVVQPNGEVRQAGASQGDTAFIAAVRARCERSLYAFAKAILKYHFLTSSLHKPVADWLCTLPPYRKLLLMPRGHGKTQLVPRSVPLHMWVQPKDGNLYLPGTPGSHARILLAGETEAMAKGNLRVVRAHLESNDLLRALWPHIAWPVPRRDAKVWNDTEVIVPRDTEFAEASAQAVGVGAAITGKHPNCLLPDDITTEAAANSDVLMQTAIEWNLNIRALLSSPQDPIIQTATYWATYDLPHVLERDATYAVNHRFRAIVTPDGTPIWPEHVTKEDVAQLAAEFGPRFFLLYMNSVHDSALVDFDKADLRFFTMEADSIVFKADPRDTLFPAELTDVDRAIEGATLPELDLTPTPLPHRKGRAFALWNLRHARRRAGRDSSALRVS
jgi:hypothetical protein